MYKYESRAYITAWSGKAFPGCAEADSGTTVHLIEDVLIKHCMHGYKLFLRTIYVYTLLNFRMRITLKNRESFNFKLVGWNFLQTPCYRCFGLEVALLGIQLGILEWTHNRTCVNSVAILCL